MILGADSKIGSYLKRYLDKKYQVITTTRRKDLVSENSIYLDLEDPENFKKNKFFDYKAAIFCAAITNQKFCEDNINLAKKLNVKSTINLIEFLVEQDIFTIFPSTSLVFGGDKPFYSASDKLNPKGIYAKLKAEVENEIILKYQKHVSIIRFSKIIDSKYILFDGWIKDLIKGRSIEAFGDYFFSPIYISHSAEVLEKICKDELSGIYNFSSQDQISYYEALKFFSKKIKGSYEGIKKISAKSIDKNFYLPKFTTLENSNGLKINSPSSQEVLERFFAENNYA